MIVRIVTPLVVAECITSVKDCREDNANTSVFFILCSLAFLSSLVLLQVMVIVLVPFGGSRCLCTAPYLLVCFSISSLKPYQAHPWFRRSGRITGKPESAGINR